MFPRAAVVPVMLAFFCLTGRPALAADGDQDAPTVRQPLQLELTMSRPPDRPAALPALYLGLAATQVFDVYSTQHGLARGAREANPLMRGGAAFWTMKAVGSAVPIVLAERMWKRNKVGAIVTMVLANGVMAAVAANNARVLGHQR
jgi:hypothetical protein